MFLVRRLAGNCMVLIAEKPGALETNNAGGFHFILEPRDNAAAIARGIDQFEIRSQDTDYALIREILSNSFNMVEPALRAALLGGKEVVRFRQESSPEPGYYELHCFPLYGSERPGLGCFLIDRTAYEIRRQQLEFKIQNLGLISQAIRAFGETRNLSEILRIILLSVTAGKGMGFNRGFILLSDDSRECLWGCMATGPSSPEEAGRIWSDLSKDPMTFDEILRLYKAGERLDVHVNRLVSSIKIRLVPDGDFIARAALEKRPLIVSPVMVENDKDREIHHKFAVDNMAVVPLLSGESLQGVLLADNIITKRPILDSDLNILEIFARYASDAIENSRLYGKLEHQISLLQEANEKIISSRENLVRAEKLSGIGRMALEVAHEVRNPLTIIGGYANLALRKMPAGDPSREVLELISGQVNRIEKTLDRFSSVVQLSEKQEDVYNLAELLEDALNMFAAEPNLEIPEHRLENGILDSRVFIDKGLFHQAFMAVIRQAARLAGGMRNMRLEAVINDKTALIFIDGGENNLKFAEDFYSVLRKRKNDQYQDMAVALEILQHYGGDIGIGALQGMHGRLYIAIPLREES